MTGGIWKGVACGALVFALVGCGPSSRTDIVSKARDVKTRADLEKALGKPDDIGKVGPVEKWTYKAKDGRVVFILVGDTVTIEKTDDADKKN
jgi:hypothetical protein